MNKFFERFLNKRDIIGVMIVLISFLIYFSWSLCLPVEQTPDEWMRFLVPKWIFTYNKLPRGDEPEIMIDLFGFSYAFTPYGSSLISVCFMKIASLFSISEKVLIIASRMTSVFSGVGTVVYCLKIGTLIFNNKESKWLFAILVAFLPQFAFLSSYLNNDVYAIFTGTVILYYWLVGIKTSWNMKSCIGLGVGLGLCALSYYNAYGYILCSIFVFCFSVFLKKDICRKWKFLFLRGILIFAIAFSIGGWFFIRNFIIYQGDFLGMDSMYACGEQYGDEAWKLSNRPTFKNQSRTVFDMLLHTQWITGTTASFFAVFGYKNIRVSNVFYVIYPLMILAGVCNGIKAVYLNKKNRYSKLLLINGMLLIWIPIILSIRYSYAYDYQSQGRYVMPGLPVIMLLASIGFESMGRYLEKKSNRFWYGTTLVGILWIIMFIVIFVKYCIPLCMGGIR